jgi:hypothetical protein
MIRWIVSIEAFLWKDAGQAESPLLEAAEAFDCSWLPAISIRAIRSSLQ